MVHSCVVTAFVLSFIIQAKAEDVIYRGTAGDGTYSEVHHSKAAIPGGEAKTITTFSSRVLGGNSPVLSSNLGSGSIENRMFGFENFGLPSPSLPSATLSPIVPQHFVNSFMTGQQSPVNPFQSGGFPSFSQFSPSGLSQFPQLQQQQQQQQHYPYVPYANEYFGDGLNNYRSQAEDQNSPLLMSRSIPPSQGLNGLQRLL